MKQPNPFNRRLFLESTGNRFEQRAVLNPTLIEEGDKLHVFYRAVDPEKISSVGYMSARYSEGGLEVAERRNCPLLAPEKDFERKGVEDPRVVRFDERYHIFYTAFDGYNARAAHAAGDSPLEYNGRHLVGPLFTNGEARKLISGNPKLTLYSEQWDREPADRFLWEKDICILPRRIGGKIVLIHRLRPDMQIAYLDSLDQLDDNGYWEDYIKHMDRYLLMGREMEWEDSHMGLGPVPIETEVGWLVIYHGVTRTPVLTYRAGAALLDLEDPQRIIGRTREPLFEPVEEWEKLGEVNNVVFPEGMAVNDSVLDIFYGGADSVIGVISVRLEELLDFLVSQKG